MRNERENGCERGTGIQKGRGAKNKQMKWCHLPLDPWSILAIPLSNYSLFTHTHMHTLLEHTTKTAYTFAPPV